VRLRNLWTGRDNNQSDKTLIVNWLNNVYSDFPLPDAFVGVPTNYIGGYIQPAVILNEIYLRITDWKETGFTDFSYASDVTLNNFLFNGQTGRYEKKRWLFPENSIF
jgi:hypothetical protein